MAKASSRRKPARDWEVEDDVPRTGLARVLVATVADLDWFARGEFARYRPQTDGRIASLGADELCLAFKGEFKRLEKESSSTTTAVK
jgi:hypothetical protein